MDADPSIAREGVFLLRCEPRSEVLVTSLETLLPVRRSSGRRHRYTELDTPDGRIRRAGARLTQSGHGDAATLAWHPHGVAPLLCQPVAGPVRFQWDVSPGPLLDALSPIVGVRCVMSLAEVEQGGTLLDVLDESGKTTARIRIESGRARTPRPRARWQPMPTVVTVTGLRGYQDVYERLIAILGTRPGLEPLRDGLQAEVARAVGAPIGEDLSRPSVDLPPTIRADAGARRIHRALLHLLRANEEGLRADLDTEFLHDFRVAVRRTRSLLSQIRHVLPPSAVEHFRTEFAWLGHITGPARDTDVLSLTVRSHAEDLLPGDQAVIAEFVARARQREHRRLVRSLDSDRYRRLLHDWQALLDEEGSEADAPNATRMLRDLVARRARRLARRITAAAAAIDEDTGATRLHRVRIDAKRLRYLVDVAPAFYDPTDIRRVLRALKRLQRVLGEFNDAHVQEVQLLACAQSLGADGTGTGAAMALGRLAEQCRNRRAQLREPVVEALTRFGDRRVRSAWRRAFAGTPDAGVAS